MSQINTAIAENLKKIRTERGLSLDKTAKLTGVSKSMLGQIEREEVNPTISTIWKIANGFKISFTEMLNQEKREIEIVSKKELDPLIEDEGKYRNYSIFPYDSERRFEVYSSEFEPGSSFVAEPHSLGSEEFITIFSGELTLTIDGEETILQKGESIRFKADVAHAYKSTGDETCNMHMLIYYAPR